MAFGVLPFVVGCGTNVNEALLLAAESSARTLFDIWLSDLYSGLPELFSLPSGPGEPVNGGGTGTGPTDGTGTGTGTGPPPGGGSSDLVGDPLEGAATFSANSCTACHCDDASGGCFPGAPNLTGKDFATIKERLQGETPHPGGKFPDLVDQDIANLEAFLADPTAP